MNTWIKLVLLAVFFVQTSFLDAAIRRWDGSSSGLWSAGANWEGGVAPANGDQLRFPGGGVTRRTITNDLPNLRPSFAFFEGADSGGYILRGNALALVGDGQSQPSW